jgi:metal transporter CNNM
MSAMFSGLTLGICGLDKLSLQVVMESGSQKQREYARRIMPVREDGNLLLCTLLLGNVSVNSALSILMADVAGGLFAAFRSGIRIFSLSIFCLI